MTERNAFGTLSKSTPAVALLVIVTQAAPSIGPCRCAFHLLTVLCLPRLKRVPCRISPFHLASAIDVTRTPISDSGQ